MTLTSAKFGVTDCTGRQMWAFSFKGKFKWANFRFEKISMDLFGNNMRALPSEASAAVSFFLPFQIPNNNTNFTGEGHQDKFKGEAECWVSFCNGTSVSEKTMIGYLEKIVAAGDPVFVIEFFVPYGFDGIDE